MRKREPDWLSKIRENCTGVIAPGAQTERQGLAGPVRVLLRGETSPGSAIN